jgi:general stress protein YciG
MAGTKAGGKAAASTNKAKYGSDFYAKIGAQGGKKGRTGGFFANRELARAAGAKGGRISRRTKTQEAEVKGVEVTSDDFELAA